MSYIKPSVLVYQELQNAGGVANVTPDLGTTMIGPLYNNVRVDQLSPTTLTNNQGISLSTQADFPTGSYVVVPLKNTKPGQIVLQSSVAVHMTEAKVRTVEFSYEVNDTAFNNDHRSRFVLADYSGIGGAYTVLVAGSMNHNRPFHELLPDGTTAHIAAGYKVDISFTNPDTLATQVVSGVISEVEYGVGNDSSKVLAINVSTPVPVFVSTDSTTAKVRIYKQYSYLVLPNVGGTQFSFTDIDDNNLRINVTTNSGINGFKAYTTSVASATLDDYLVVSGKVSTSYRALRQDLYSTIVTVSSTAERESLLGEATEDNPLGLAVQIALDNTTKQVFAVSLKSTDTLGSDFEWSRAAELLENHRASYALVPLTQDKSVLTLFQTHARQLSTPELASWRVVIGNTAIPSTINIVAESTDANTTGTAKVVNDDKFLQDLTESFVAKSVTPGDIVVITSSGSGNAAVGSWVVSQVVNDTVLSLEGFDANLIADGQTITYYIVRNLTRRGRAEQVAANSAVFGANGGNRFWHVQPDIVGVDVNGVTKYLPGYYLAAALGGTTSGEAVQQGFTNMPVAGITDLQNSNFYFVREELNIMAGAGVCLFVQDTQGGTPYCRHALTTDTSGTLEYKEILKVKNWDFLSFYFYDKLKGFIGTWNITPDTLSNMKQVINASIELLKGQKLPRIGAPLLSGTILLLQQNAVNKDNIDIRLQVEIVSPNNYTNLYLVI